MKNKSDWFSLPWRKLFSHSGQRGPTLPEVLYGAYYVAHAGAQEKRKRASCWRSSDFTQSEATGDAQTPKMKGNVNSYHWVNSKVSETQLLGDKGKVDAFPAN